VLAWEWSCSCKSRAPYFDGTCWSLALSSLALVRPWSLVVLGPLVIGPSFGCPSSLVPGDRLTQAVEAARTTKDQEPRTAKDQGRTKNQGQRTKNEQLHRK
jgi:hypothetical protein